MTEVIIWNSQHKPATFHCWLGKEGLTDFAKDKNKEAYKFLRKLGKTWRSDMVKVIVGSLRGYLQHKGQGFARISGGDMNGVIGGVTFKIDGTIIVEIMNDA